MARTQEQEDYLTEIAAAGILAQKRFSKLKELDAARALVQDEVLSAVKVPKTDAEYAKVVRDAMAEHPEVLKVQTELDEIGKPVEELGAVERFSNWVASFFESES